MPTSVFPCPAVPGGSFLPLYDVYDGRFVSIVMEYMHNVIHFGLFLGGVEIVRVGSVNKISYGGHFVLERRIRVHGDNGICGSGFPVNVIRKTGVCFFYGDV